jgi:hypothetical protein
MAWIELKQIHKFPPGWKSRAARPGTAAHDYISGRMAVAKVADDPRTLGGKPQPDGVLVAFKDGSSVVVLKNMVKLKSIPASSVPDPEWGDNPRGGTTNA